MERELMQAELRADRELMQTELRRLEQNITQISRSNNILVTHDITCAFGSSSATRVESCELGTGFANADLKFKDTFDGSVPLREFLTQFELL